MKDCSIQWQPARSSRVLLAFDSRYPPNLKGFHKWFSNVPQGTDRLLDKENLELRKCMVIPFNCIRGQTSELHSLGHVCLEGLHQVLPSRKACLSRTNKAGKSEERTAW